MGQSLQQISKPEKLFVTLVVVPADSWDCIFGLEHVGNRRVINDDHVLHIAAKSRQILDEGVIVEGTVLSEKFVAAQVLRVQLTHQRLCIFWKWGSEHHNLIFFGHSLEELLYVRSYKDVDRIDLTIDFDWQGNIWIFYKLELRMHQSLVQIED